MKSEARESLNAHRASQRDARDVNVYTAVRRAADIFLQRFPDNQPRPSPGLHPQ